MTQPIGVWFPAVHCKTGADMITVRLAAALNQRGIRSEIGWLPHRAEYAPWTVRPPAPPVWANIVHINTWLHGRFVPPHLPVVATLHSCVHDPAFTPFKNISRKLYHRFWIKHCEMNSIRRSSLVTAVSHYTAERAIEIFGRKDIMPVHNWINSRQFSPDDRKVPHHPFRLLFVGTPRRSKGLDLLPAIMRHLGSDFELHVTGSTADIVGLQALPANMVAIGRLQGDHALVGAYRNCDALMFPTRLEGFGLVALEAQACGRPVITTRGFSLPEVVEHGETGILCPVDNIQAFVTAVRKLRDDPAVWRQMSLAASDRAVKKFSEDKIITRYINLYNSVLSRKTRF